MDYFATYFLEIFTSVTWQQLVMYLIGGALIWLAIKKNMSLPSFCPWALALFW